MEICRITRHEFIPVHDLMMLCFKDSDAFPNYSKDDWDKLIPQIQFFIDSGFCYGCYDNSRLFSLILACDYKTLKDSILFDDIFAGNSDISDFLNKEFEKNNQLIYVPITCTHPKYRNKGHVQVLIRYLLAKNHGNTYISDVVNPIMEKVFVKFGFCSEKYKDINFLIKR